MFYGCEYLYILSVFVSVASVENVKCGLFIVNSHEGKVPFLHSYLNVFALLQFYVHHSRDRSLMQDRTIEECSEFVEFEHVDGSKYCEFKKKKKATCQQDAVTHEGPLFTLAPSCHPVCREV